MVILSSPDSGITVHGTDTYISGKEGVKKMSCMDSQQISNAPLSECKWFWPHR